MKLPQKCYETLIKNLEEELRDVLKLEEDILNICTLFTSKLNCEVLYDDLAFEVRWAIAGDSIVLQLVAKLENGEYMSFGISGDKLKTKMIDADVAVAWVDKETLKGYAADYYLADKSQCSGPTGSCPDERLGENTNSIRLLNAAIVNGYSIVTYQRPLKASDKYDQEILTNELQAIAWGIGPLNQRNEVSFHTHWAKKDFIFDFGRQPKWNCPMPETEQPNMKPANYHKSEPTTITSSDKGLSSTTSRSRTQQRRRGEVIKQAVDNAPNDSENSISRTRQRGQSNRQVPTPAPVVKREAWKIPPIQCYEPEDGVYYAQMGPTGGKRGYSAITDHVGWGISWYINGLLIPEINLVRGKSYTFVVEGGLDPEVPAKYHPFYITDDPIGGYEYKTPEEREKIKIYAGVKEEADGTILPTGIGRLCHWTYKGDLDADDYESFGAYQRTLELKCDNGEPGVIQFTPDKNTPNTLYYQCFTHRYLGWKINVLDSCDTEGAASEQQPVIELLKNGNLKLNQDDLDDSPSIRVESRVKAPNSISNDNKDVSLFKLEPDVVETTTAPLSDIPVQPTVNSVSHPGVLDEQRLDSRTSEGYTHSEKHNIDISSNPEKLILEKISTERTAVDDKAITRPYPFIFGRPNRIMIPHPFSTSTNIRPLNVVYKKPIYNPSSFNRPLFHKYHEKPMHLSVMPPFVRPQSVLLFNKQVPLMIVKKGPEANTNPEVEVSPQQLSTEREPQNATESSYSVILPHEPSKLSYEGYHQALNTGFNPKSVVIEGGFKPIISKEIQNRNVEGPELKYESEVGIINVDKQKNKAMFVLGSRNKMSEKNFKHKNNGVMFVIKQTREERKEALPLEDEVAEAAERVESFYLPPVDRREKPEHHITKPSNIDVAPGTVVTYDGKKLSGASLTVRVTDRGSTILDSRASKAAELIRSSPQFGPFRGDLPPLHQTFINTNAPQLQHRGVLNRDLESPPNSYLPLPPESSHSSTKLLLVRPLDETNQEEQSGFHLGRSKRAAHHTEEHTAEQNAQKMNSHNHTEKSISSRHLNSVILHIACTYVIITFYTLIRF